MTRFNILAFVLFIVTLAAGANVNGTSCDSTFGVHFEQVATGIKDFGQHRILVFLWDDLFNEHRLAEEVCLHTQPFSLVAPQMQSSIKYPSIEEEWNMYKHYFCMEKDNHPFMSDHLVPHYRGTRGLPAILPMLAPIVVRAVPFVLRQLPKVAKMAAFVKKNEGWIRKAVGSVDDHGQDLRALMAKVSQKKGNATESSTIHLKQRSKKSVTVANIIQPAVIDDPDLPYYNLTRFDDYFRNFDRRQKANTLYTNLRYQIDRWDLPTVRDLMNGTLIGQGISSRVVADKQFSDVLKQLEQTLSLRSGMTVTCFSGDLPNAHKLSKVHNVTIDHTSERYLFAAIVLDVRCAFLRPIPIYRANAFPFPIEHNGVTTWATMKVSEHDFYVETTSDRRKSFAYLSTKPTLISENLYIVKAVSTLSEHNMVKYDCSFVSYMNPTEVMKQCGRHLIVNDKTEVPKTYDATAISKCTLYRNVHENKTTFIERRCDGQNSEQLAVPPTSMMHLPSICGCSYKMDGELTEAPQCDVGHKRETVQFKIKWTGQDDTIEVSGGLPDNSWFISVLVLIGIIAGLVIIVCKLLKRQPALQPADQRQNSNTSSLMMDRTHPDFCDAVVNV